MTRTYFLSYLEWLGTFNAGHCHTFKASTDTEARMVAAEHLAGRRTSFARLRCTTDRLVRLAC